MRNEAWNKKISRISSFFILSILILAVGCGGGGGGGGKSGGPVCTDADSDGYYAESGCNTAVDCNDASSAVKPGAVEVCSDSLDNDCDGTIDCADDDCTADATCQTCTDGDSDNFYGQIGCGTNVDCDDDDATVKPGGTEVCDDALDNDCDGTIDCGDSDCTSDFACQTCTDGDADGFPAQFGCPAAMDCDDGDVAIKPGAIEICDDGIDNDCDGTVDCADTDCAVDTACQMQTCTDADADTYYVESGCGSTLDCRDNNAAIHPGAAEVCDDSADNDCDGTIDCADSDCINDTVCQVCTDGDGDTYYAESGCGTNIDCNDANASIKPGAAEICGDGIDQDCDGSDQLCEDGVDNDGDGYTENQGDCDDGDATINPGATETADDGIDQDCDGYDLVTWYLDDDGDGYGDAASTTTANSNVQPTGYVSDNTDCNDGDANINPGATETCKDFTDNDCDGNADCADSVCAVDTACAAGVYYYNSLGMGFKLINAGTFTMGSPDGALEYPVGGGTTPSEELGRDSDEVAHQVTLTQNYYMQITEVTQGQWEAVMGSNPSFFINCGDNCPVEQVSWNDVQTFITNLNAVGEGTYRLPTEAEWEYAARAGSTTAFTSDGDITVTGCNAETDLEALGWYCYNSEVSYNGCHDYSGFGGATCAGINPVGQKTANAWGLFDMHGNVFEWCQDYYDAYPAGPLTDPAGPVSGTNRVVRDGAWTEFIQSCRSANRGQKASGSDNGDLGFRLVRPP